MEIPAEVLAAVGAAVVTGYGALWWQVRDRIQKLEKAVSAAAVREAAAQEARIAAANSFAEAMRQMTERTAKALERTTAVTAANQEVLGRLLDTLGERPCLLDRPEPRPQTLHQGPAHALDARRAPSSAELPPAHEPPTEQHSAQDARWRTTR